jgi:5'-nucleotidase
VRELKAAPLGVVLETPLRRGRNTESALGNLFTDAFRASVKGADVAINNTDGGLRADLPAGPLTYGSLFEVFPFDNRLVTLRLTGRDLRRVVAKQLQRNQAPLGISGVRVDARCAGGVLDVGLRSASGRTIRDEQTLLVVTTDFLATGGDEILAPAMPAGGFALASPADDSPVARDVVAAWFRRHGGRLREEQFLDASHSRWGHAGPLPMDCRAR